MFLHHKIIYRDSQKQRMKQKGKGKYIPEKENN